MTNFRLFLQEEYGIEEIENLQPLGKPTTAADRKKPPNTFASIVQRSQAIAFAVQQTAQSNQETIEEVIDIFGRWMSEEEIVRIVGAGRALIAATIPANRLAHGGARVSIVGSLVPLPNTSLDGAILASSASGETEFVLHLLDIARKLNPNIERVGIADKDAVNFRELCDHFIGIDISTAKQMSDFFALADLGEFVISELLDALVVSAGDRIGIKEIDWKRGHEDLGPTGPYSPEE